jgi:hypothetical protein
MRANIDDDIFVALVHEVTKTLCPTALSPHLCRIDSASQHPHKALYESDSTYLKVSRQSAFLREAKEGEFDFTPSRSLSAECYPTLALQSAPTPNAILLSLKRYIPRLWTLVTDVGNGTHHVTAIYRGSALWATIERDGNQIASFRNADEFRHALEAIQACEGQNVAEWERFCTRVYDVCMAHIAAAEPKGPAIN